jgi:hypothetical protein
MLKEKFEKYNFMWRERDKVMAVKQKVDAEAVFAIV